jgi:dihydrofolate reductase
MSDTSTGNGKVVVNRSMSLDGFIAGPGHAMDWIFDFVAPDEFPEIAAATGAMLIGRRTYEVANRMDAERGSASSGKTYPFPGPVFVLTHRPPEPPDPEVTFLTGDIGEAVATARSAAGGKNLEILGADVAAQCLERGLVDRIVLSRPAVEAGERLGFLPGDMREKVDPYLRPLYDALYDVLPQAKVERDLDTGIIEIAPLAFMRGRTLAHSFVILDEAQNTTSMQMKMFLTRLGEGSKMAVTGDPSQVDLPPGQRSGLEEAVGLLSGIRGIEAVRFSSADVVRRDLVARIVDAYDHAV